MRRQCKINKEKVKRIIAIAIVLYANEPCLNFTSRRRPYFVIVVLVLVIKIKAQRIEHQAATTDSTELTESH